MAKKKKKKAARAKGPKQAKAPADVASADTVEHRTAPRVSVVVEIHLSSESHFFSGLSGDMSEGGEFVSTYRPLSMGSSVDLEFHLPGPGPDNGAPVKAKGQVRWLREHSVHEPRGVGIAFEDLAPEDRARIQRFCTMRPPLYYEDVG